jgi:hypothetical protein
MILTARPRTVENKAGCTLASAFGLVWLLRIDAYLVIFSSRLMTNRQCTYLARISPDMSACRMLANYAEVAAGHLFGKV